MTRHRSRLCLIIITGLAGCSNEASHVPNPLLLPFYGIGNAVQNAAYGERRGAVEVFVKTNHPALIADIDNGGGDQLIEAMNLARVAAKDRDILTLRLQSERALYARNQEALIVALMVHGQ